MRQLYQPIKLTFWSNLAFWAVLAIVFAVVWNLPLEWYWRIGAILAFGISVAVTIRRFGRLAK